MQNNITLFWLLFYVAHLVLKKFSVFLKSWTHIRKWSCWYIIYFSFLFFLCPKEIYILCWSPAIKWETRWQKFTTKKIAINDGQSLSQQHKKPSQISIVDGKRPSTAVGKSLVGNTILPTRPLLTLIFDSITPS